MIHTLGAVFFFLLIISDYNFIVSCIELLGTPGYLAPEMLKKSVEPSAPGYNKQVDL